MMTINNISNVFLVGIGGIGMSALARYFKSMGLVVYGYDKTRTDLTDKLEDEGFKISFIDELQSLPNCCRSKNDETLVIYTPAIPQDSVILNHFKYNNFKPIKRSEALAEITKNNFTIAVAGTHGKTTTSTYIAHILVSNGISSAAFLGGISSNYNTNYVSYNSSENSVIVVEADEFDRSFLRLQPNVSIITSCEADHLDIYGNYDNLKQAYNDFANCTVKGGKLFIHEKLKRVFNLRDDLDVRYYGETGDISCNNIRVENNKFLFDLPIFNLKNIENGLPGRHNILNATAAIAASLTIPQLHNPKESIATFKGIKRRFEQIYVDKECVYIDDYAHHPTEINAAISTAKELYPHQRITVVFQPHLFTRTRDFADDFKSALANADELILMPIYPAREMPIEGITSQIIAPKSNSPICDHDAVIDLIKNNKPAVLLTLGAGNIDKLVQPIAKLLKSKSHV